MADLSRRLSQAWLVAVGEEEEQALDLDAAAVGEQRLQPRGTERAQPLHQHVGLMEGFLVGELVEQFEDGALGS